MKRHGGDEVTAKFVYDEQMKRVNVDFVPDCRFAFALELVNLQNAGFPLKANDITLEQWGYIAQLKNAIIEKQNKEIKENAKRSNN